MLKGFRTIGQSVVGKALITVLFGFLILSFGIWGIGDIFRGYGTNTAVKVGSVEISTNTLRDTYQTELQSLTRRLRQVITPEKARALGLQQQVLAQVVGQAALDQKARDLGLAVSDEAIAKAILEDPTFRDASGQFNRAAFNDILRSNGLTEAAYIREQHLIITRRQLADSVSGALTVPMAMREAIYRYGAERRAADYVVLPATAAGDVADPDEATLKPWFDERKALFRAPEYRKVSVLVVTPDALAKTENVSDEDARARYEKEKTSRFGTPERRHLEQIVFPSEAEAREAADKIKEGTSFEAVAAERGVTAKDLDLGTLAKDQVIDPAVAQAAFALPESGVSEPVKGSFGYVLVKAVGVEPASVKPYEEVAADLKRDIANERARSAINDVHDKIEDERASAKPLADTAAELGVPLRTIDAVDRSGRDKNGQEVTGLPTGLLEAAFASDVGADNEPLRLADGGYAWFDVAGVEPARDRKLDEVRAEAVKQWRTEEIANRLTAKSRDLVARLEKGETLDALAGELGLTVKKADGLLRNGSKDDLSVPVVTQIFATPVKKAGSAAAGQSGDTRVVFQVTAATIAPFPSTSQQASALEQQLKIALSDDLLGEYVTKLQADYGVSLNQQAIRTALGGGAEE